MPTTFCFLKSCSDREILCSIVSNGCRVGDCRTEYLGPLQAFGTCFMANRKRPRRSSEVGSVRWIEYRLGEAQLLRVQLNVRVTLSAGKGAFWVIPEWVQGVAAGQMDESWINKHGQLDSKGGPWQNAFPKSRSLPGAKQV